MKKNKETAEETKKTERLIEDREITEGEPPKLCKCLQNKLENTEN